MVSHVQVQTNYIPGSLHIPDKSKPMPSLLGYVDLQRYSFQPLQHKEEQVYVMYVFPVFDMTDVTMSRDRFLRDKHTSTSSIFPSQH